jgi:hypothetical protein
MLSSDVYFFITSEGKVEMLGKESIHAIVLGVFSVAIMSEDIHQKFKFRVRSTVLLIMTKNGSNFIIVLLFEVSLYSVSDLLNSCFSN